MNQGILYETTNRDSRTNGDYSRVTSLTHYLLFASKVSTLALTFIGFFLFLFLVFPTLPINGELLGVRFWYSYEEAMVLLDEYGPNGRMIYLWSSFLLDTLFPIIYVTFLAGLIHRCRISESTWWLALVPIIGGVIDLLENLQISIMLLSYPTVSELQVLGSTVCTATKHGIFCISVSIALVLMLIAVIRVVRNSKS